ncbi:MAG: glycosyltransferase family 2 protein [Lachnospiraceae bacterium]|nr:glycosyltransferase family 2 protein [Lachnospiraceae bacterium]
MDKICVVIPTYNESGSIGRVVGEIRQSCPGADIVVVDDGSSDGTKQITEATGCTVISLCANLGIGGAVQAGLMYAVSKGYKLVVRMDGDGQHDPGYISGLCGIIEDGGADIAIGSRYVNHSGYQSTRTRRAGIRFLSFIISRLCGADIKDVTSGYWAMNGRAAEHLSENYEQDYPEPEAILSSVSAGYRIVEVPVEMRGRTSGKSTIDIKRSLYYMIKVTFSLLFAKLNLKGERHAVR